MPAAAAERLRDVVGFEIERQTPFAADAVAFDARVLARREGDGAIDAELVAVPRAALDPQLAALGPLAPLLAGIDVAGNDGAPLRSQSAAAGATSPQPRSLAALESRSSPRWRWCRSALTLWQVLENRRDAAEAFDAAIASASRAGTSRGGAAAGTRWR